MQPEGSKPDEPAPASPWQFTSDETAMPTAPPSSPKATNQVQWSASEYVAHHKSPAWFMCLGLVIVVIVGVAYAITKDVFSSLAILVIGIAFVAFAGRQPKVLEYGVNDQGIQIGGKFYPYGVFKTFSVVEEGPLHSIMLMPLRRFMPAITMYYDPADEDTIIKVLADYLPFEEARRDSIDRLMKRIRF